MKYFVITDSTDTQVGLRLAGIEGVVVREIPEARKAIQDAAADPDIAVLLVTENLAGQVLRPAGPPEAQPPISLWWWRSRTVTAPAVPPTPSPVISARPSGSNLTCVLLL